VDADVGEGSQDLGQLVDVDAGSSVDVRRVLLGEQVNPHSHVSSVGSGWGRTVALVATTADGTR
jgi:hypothetical protein